MTPCPYCSRPFEGDLCPTCDDAVDVEKALGLLGPSAARRSSLPPREIGRFRVVRRLGEGGTGVVYEALDPVLGRPLALKILKAHGLGPELVERFLREARFLARFRHPNVVQIYELGRHEGRDFLAMELIEGKPFPATSDRREAVARLARVARALAHIHRRSIVHRDLKPSNILVDPTGRPVVMDFGIARSAETISTLSLAGSLVGTPAYMSPEQFAGETADARTDVYALGVILYEVLAGRRPYDGKTVVALAQQVRDGNPAPIPGVPEDLSRACLRALAVRPEHRFSTADAFAEALEHHLHGSPSSRRRRSGRDPRLVWALGGAVAGLLVLFAFAAFRPVPFAASAETVDPRPFVQEGRRLSMAGRFEDAHAAFDRALAVEAGSREAVLAKGDMTVTQQFALHVDRLHFPETIRALGARLAATQGPAFDRIGSPLAAVYAHIARGEWEAAARGLASTPDATHLKAAIEFFQEGRYPGGAVRSVLQQRRESAGDPVREDRDLWLVYAGFQEIKPVLPRVAPPRSLQRTSTHAGLLRLEAYMHDARGERDKALNALDRALASAPDFLPARLARARLLQQMGSVSDAAAELQSARRQALGWGFAVGELDTLLR
jgi:tetratricopeptide (TPR) repeat protein/predicted Ser/Thr protein kinase